MMVSLPLPTIQKKGRTVCSSYNDHHFVLLGRLSLSLATVTELNLPSISLPFNLLMAWSASVEELISTNPNPRLLPVSRSVITLADETWPKDSNNLRKSSSLV